MMVIFIEEFIVEDNDSGGDSKVVVFKDSKEGSNFFLDDQEGDDEFVMFDLLMNFFVSSLSKVDGSEIISE